MGIVAKLEKLVPDLGAVIARFPVPVLISISLFIYLNSVDRYFDVFSSEQSWAFVAAFLAGGAAHLFAEARGMPKAVNYGGAVAAAGVTWLIASFAEVFHPVLLFLIPGLILLVMVAGFLRRDAKQGALWLFNLRLGLAALLAIIVGLLFGAGLSAIIESLRFLFDVPFPNEFHEYIWRAAIALVGPVYGLSLVPKTFAEEVQLADHQNTLVSRGVAVLVNYVLVPIAVVYALILHAYAIKIALTWELPRGEIGAMATIFALGGTATWLVAWPWRDSGTRLLRLFIRSWFWLTIVPMILLAIAIWRRVSEYGVTPERYGLVLVAAWLALLIPYFAWRRNRADMRAILGGLAVLMIAGSFGPWGAYGLTISSQFERLQGLLEANGVLKDGKVVAGTPATPDEAKTNGYSIVDSLRNAGGLDRLRPWFEGDAADPFKPSPAASGADTSYMVDVSGWQQAEAINKRLNFVSYVPDDKTVFLMPASAIALDIDAGSKLLGPISLPGPVPQSSSAEVSGKIENEIITFQHGGQTWTVPVKSLLEQVKSVPAIPSAQQKPLSVPLGENARIIVISLNGQMGPPPTLYSAQFWLILRQP